MGECISSCGRTKQLYSEQEGIIGATVECILIEGNGMDSSGSSDESSYVSESKELLGVEELEEGWGRL
jgi:hypothetical protein